MSKKKARDLRVFDLLHHEGGCVTVDMDEISAMSAFKEAPDGEVGLIYLKCGHLLEVKNNELFSSAHEAWTELIQCTVCGDCGCHCY